MGNTREKIKAELLELIKKGYEIHKASIPWDDKNLFEIGGKYQTWYTSSLPVVQQLLPHRYTEFHEQYRIEKRKEITSSNYGISDFLSGTRLMQYGREAIDHHASFLTKFHNQLRILESAVTRLDSLLADIRTVLQAELFDDELSVAQELKKKNHLRAAGAVAGVVLEKHLCQAARSGRQVGPP